MAITSPRVSSRNYRIAPEAFYGDLNQLLKAGNPKPAFRQIIEWMRQIAEVGNRTQAGKTNNLGTFTVGTSSATTTLTDKRIGANSVIHFASTTASAATELATLYQTYPNVTEGQAVINHANSAVADRTYAYTVFG